MTPEISERDFEAVFSRVNDPDLLHNVADLEDEGYLAEVSWLESAVEDLEIRLQTLQAIAVCSARGELKDFKITLPRRDSDEK